MGIDEETADELISSFDEHYDEMQTLLNRLGRQSSDISMINELFRSMHTVKGNAGMVQMHELVGLAHAMEETIGAMRSGNFAPTELICDLLLVGLDRLKDLHYYHLCDKPHDDFDEELLHDNFISIAESNSQAEADTSAKKFYQVLYPDLAAPADKEEVTLKEEQVSDHRLFLNCGEEAFTDLDLFRELALQIDQKNDFWDGRTDRLVYLGIKLCALSKDVSIDNTQLVAAIYMHDAGMAFLPNELVNKQAKLNAMEFKKLKQHVNWGYQLVQRMSGWEQAATIVLHHHERGDGQGYPNGLSDDQICEEAKVVAILDAFYAMTNLRSDRTHRRSVLRAIAEINACTGTQFDGYWVDLFNQLIRNEVRNGHL